MRSATSNLLAFRASKATAKTIDDQRDALRHEIAAAKGEKGDKPDHQWKGTELRFEKPDGTWGKYVDLRGPKGRGGSGGTASSFDPTTLPILPDSPAITDYLVLERDGVAYRVSIEALQSILGGTTAPGLNDVTVDGTAVTVNGITVKAT